MSECGPIQGHLIVHAHQPRGSERCDSSVLCDVAAVIENLNDEQWMAVTGGMSDMARLDFVEECVNMISALSRTAYQTFKPIVQIFGSELPRKSPGTADSTDSSLKRSPLDIPFVHALCVEILHEAKGACLEAIKKISLSGLFTGSGDGLMARWVQLKEETVKGFFSRLEALDLSVQKPDTSRLLDTRALKALGASDVTQEVVTAILSVMKKSCLNQESAKAATHLSRVVARMIKVLASPKACENKLSLDSFYRAIEQVPPIHLTAVFQMQVHKAVLCVLLRYVSCPLVGSQFISKPWKNAVLSYLTTARTILMDTVDTVVEVLAAKEVGEERFCTDAITMFSEVDDQVKLFMVLGNITGLSKSKRSLAALQCVDSVTEDQPVASCESSQGKETCASQKLIKAAAANTKELNKDVGDAQPKRMISKVRNHKKYFSRRRNAVGVMESNQAYASGTDTLRQNHLQENITFTSSVVITVEGSKAAASRSQRENACAPNSAAERSKKRNIFTRFFLSITKPLRTCIKSSDRN